MSDEKILVVEDNLTNMELVTDLLEASGYSVLTATTAEEGIKIAGEEAPDLILMDISLPGMDGLTATRVLKGDPITKRLPVAALTAHAMEGDEAKAIAAGCVAYITKPINTRTFSKTIAMLIADES
jgi:two-component system, cell cycle response regulator DivK